MTDTEKAVRDHALVGEEALNAAFKACDTITALLSELDAVKAERDALVDAGLKCCDGVPNPDLKPFDLAMSFIDSTNTARKAADMLWQEYKADRDRLREQLVRMVDLAENRLVAIHKALNPDLHGITGIESRKDHIAYMTGILQSAYDGKEADLSPALESNHENEG